MATIYHQTWIEAPGKKVFEGISTAEGLSCWWSPHEQSETADGTVLSHDPGPEHGVVKQKIIDMVPNRRIEWECVSSGHPETSPASAWLGTHVIFELSEQKNRAYMTGFGKDGDPVTVLDFKHTGWDETSQYLGFCGSAWGEVLGMLKTYCEKSEPPA